MILTLSKKIITFFPALNLLITLLLSNISFSQPDYNMNITNPAMISEDIIEFDVLIKSINNNFCLTSYQCSFLFNAEIILGGSLIFTYIEGSSQLKNLPNFGVGINSLDGEPKLTFASTADADTITEEQKLVGKFRLQSTTPFLITDPQIIWNFDGIVSTILTGESFQNITVPANHTYSLVLGLNSQNSTTINEFKLLQNYPNPFNPTTQIRFDIPKDSHVKLEVYNMLGEEIEMLVNDYLYAGLHTVDFVSKGLASGMYFCKLKVDNKFVEIIKMILIR